MIALSTLSYVLCQRSPDIWASDQIVITVYSSISLISCCYGRKEQASSFRFQMLSVLFSFLGNNLLKIIFTTELTTRYSILSLILVDNRWMIAPLKLLALWLWHIYREAKTNWTIHSQTDSFIQLAAWAPSILVLAGGVCRTKRAYVTQ